MGYKASLDTLGKIMTVGVFVLFIPIGQKNVRALYGAQGDTAEILIHSGVLLLFVAIIMGSYLYNTKGYTVTAGELIIHRPIKDKVISITDITQIRPVDSSEFSGTIRAFGNGGLFGYCWKSYNSKIGNMTWYVTQRRNRILVLTEQGDKIIISPDEGRLSCTVLWERRGETPLRDPTGCHNSGRCSVNN